MDRNTRGGKWKIIPESVIDEIREREEDERRLYEKRA